MPELSVDLDVLRHALFGRSLQEVGDSLLKTSITGPIRIGMLSFTPTAALSVRVLNRDDKDEDAVFASDPDAHIPADAQSAWVKYKVSAKANARLAFAAAATAETSDVELNDYRLHASTDAAWNAVTSDLASPRTLLDLDDVRTLQPGEALSMELGGTLTMSASFSWADAIAAKLHEITRMLPRTIPISLKLKAGLEASATVKVKDRFAVVVSRTRDGHHRIAVKKASSRNHAFAIDVSLGADANAVPAIEEVLAPLLDGVRGAVIEAAGSAGSDEIENFEKDLRRKLQQIAHWKASTGFAYEYARIDENTAIADYILLDDARLGDDYAVAMAGDFDRIARSLRQETSARRVVRYLSESEMTRRSSSGFSLAGIEAGDESVFRQTTRTSLDGFRLITSRGTRKYDEKNIPQNDFEWTVDLKAQMTDFVSNPTTRDFDYGLHYLVTLERAALREDDVDRMLDFAAMWDVCVTPADEFAEALHRKATVRVQLLIERDQLAAILGAIPKDVDDAWAVPLAMAMPYMSTFAERKTFASRRDLYTDAWREWLRGGSPALPRIRSGLRVFETRALPGSFAWTSETGHPQLRRRLEAFMRGARRLHAAMTTEQAPEVIGEAYTSLETFWSQRLYVAASGRYLLDRARDAGVEISRSLRFDYAETTTLS